MQGLIKKIIILVLSFFIFWGQIFVSGLYAYNLIPEYLCQLGQKLYQEGKLKEALEQFHKALLAAPDYTPAIRYIQLIEEELKAVRVTLPSELKLPPSKPLILEEKPKKEISPREKVIAEFLERFQKPEIAEIVSPPTKEKITKKLFLEEGIENLKFPLEIEKDTFLVIEGINIQRFLNTNDEIILVEKIDPNQIKITPKNLGFAILHIWDSRKRWTLEFLVVPLKPAEVISVEEELAREGSFKLRYSLDWSLYESGRRIDDLQRISYYWTHWLGLTGQSPYGNIDSSLSVRVLGKEEELSYLTVGLEDGSFAGFNGFTLRGFDFLPQVTNLAFSGVNLRGGMFSSPAFENKLKYTVFGGKEGYGRYTGLSPGLTGTRKSYISGFNLNFRPQQNTGYDFSVFYGWGKERAEDLNPYGYDLSIEKRIKDFLWDYELAYDSETFAHLFNIEYHKQNFSLSSEFRNTDKDFRTMTGWGWRAGEIGMLTALNYKPKETLDISGRLDLFRDRLYPNLENPKRWNQDFDADILYSLSHFSSLRYDLSFHNELGRVFPLRYFNTGVGFYHTFEKLKKLSTYINYRYQQMEYPNNPASDYINNRIILGLRFNLLGGLYYFLSKEFDWVESRYYHTISRPAIFETGLDYYEQILKTPFWMNLRFIFHDEENTESPFSFMAGEDYIEGFSEISYRPKPDIEAFVSSRIRNIWQENPSATKRFDADFYAGMRYVWDTGIVWNPVGDIEGYVFKDFNGDGLRQNDEPPIEGVKLNLGKKKTAITDIFGYFRFGSVRAKKINVSLDTSSIPSGFVLTTPAVQEVSLRQGIKSKLYFGLISNTEIQGFVFEDVEGDGQYSYNKDIPIKNVVLILDEENTAKTDESGRYSFSRLKPGKHTLKVDLKSLAVDYLPLVEVIREMELSEGQTVVYSIPVRKIKP